jgi:hypothetical protein
MDAYLLTRAKRGLEAAMADVAADVVQELNEANQLDEMIIEHFPEAKSWKYHVASTDKILIAAAGPKNATIPKLQTTPDGTLGTSMELLVKTTWKESLVLKAALAWSSTQDLLQEVLPADLAKSISDDVTLATKDGWFVISIGRKAVIKAIDELEKQSKE